MCVVLVPENCNVSIGSDYWNCDCKKGRQFEGLCVAADLDRTRHCCLSQPALLRDNSGKYHSLHSGCFVYFETDHVVGFYYDSVFGARRIYCHSGVSSIL